MHKVAEATGFRFFRELRGGNDGGMGRREGKVQKERLIGFLLVDPFDTFSRQRWHDRPKIPVFDHRARPTFPISFRCWSRIAQHYRGFGNHSIVFKPSVRWKIWNIISKIVVEAMRQGSTGNRLAPIEGVWTKVLALLFILSFLGVGIRTSVGFVDSVPIPTEMPLANASGLIAFRFQELGRVVFSSSNIG